MNREKPLSLWAVELSPDVRLHRKRLMSTPQISFVCTIIYLKDENWGFILTRVYECV